MSTSVENNTLSYLGTMQPAPNEVFQGKPVYPYIPDSALKDAVNLAIYLNRPLLVKGEPGSGKTQLASAVAYELGLPLETWYIKSRTNAKEGLYTYDTLGRLRDAQLVSSGYLSESEKARFDNPMSYIQWGPLGRAFQNEKRTVVLIDEIDKADIDFPNDLLLELDEQVMRIPEVQVDGRELELRAQSAPIVLITSNDEKDLPDAFLRRCLFFYIQFPSYEQIVKITQTRFPDISATLVEKAVYRFLELRKTLKQEGGRGKSISTSELIDWVQSLNRHSPEKITELLNQSRLPHLEVLLKSWEAHTTYLQLSQAS